ncbi:MAG TPA: sugar ABC transporter substrate-binding protein [Capillimicrobium sp.]
MTTPRVRRAHAGRRFAALAVAGAVALTGTAIAGCGGDDEGGGGDDGSGGGTTTLTFVHPQDPGTFDKVIAGFEKANPDIKIEEQIVPFDDLNPTIQSRLGSNDPSIDLYDVDEPRLAAFAARGFLAEVGDLREQAEGKVDPNALDITTYQGKQYAMPRWTSTQLLFFNTKLLQKAGVEAPSSDPEQPMTWEDLASAGAKAQSAGARWGMTFDQVDRYYQLQPLPESLGGGPGLTGDDMLTPDVTNPAWIEAFDWYASTFRDGLAPRGVAPEQTAPLFAAGNTAFYAGGPWNAAGFDDAKVDYGVAPFPLFEGGEPATSTDSWSTGISPFSEHQEEAKKFLAYMTIDAQGAWEASSNNLPVQNDAFQKYLDELRKQGDRASQLADIIEHALAETSVSRPTTVGWVDFETAMNKAFADIRNGSDPAERLQAASEELDRLLAKYRDQ